MNMTNNSALICPNDKTAMHSVKIESHYGQWVVLDQCPDCGGIWFDKSELYMAKQGQADKIELLNAAILRTPSPILDSALICPLDRAKLVRFVDPYFPKDIVIVRCPLCEGIWLNRGEFTKYQTFRQEKFQKSKQRIIDIPPEPNIDQILAQQTSGDAVDTLGRLGKFLSTPMDSRTMQPLSPNSLSDNEKNSINLLVNLLTTVLRLFIRL
jgi:Zn-finger nucleic acid-binding protein